MLPIPLETGLSARIAGLYRRSWRSFPKCSHALTQVRHRAARPVRYRRIFDAAAHRDRTGTGRPLPRRHLVLTRHSTGILLALRRQQRPSPSSLPRPSAEREGGGRLRQGSTSFMDNQLFRRLLILSCGVLLLNAAVANAQDRLCDPGDEDCRAILIDYIRNERVGIDVAFWFMEDARYTNELIKKRQEGVLVRVLMDPRANADYPLNASRLGELQTAGIPMRKRLTSYILHWK